MGKYIQTPLKGLGNYELKDVQNDIEALRSDWSQFSDDFIGEHPAFSTNPLARKIPIKKKLLDDEGYVFATFGRAFGTLLANGAMTVVGPSWLPFGGGFLAFVARQVVMFAVPHFLPYLLNPESITDRGARDVVGCNKLGDKCDAVAQKIDPIREKIIAPYLFQLQNGASDMGRLTQENALKVVEEFLTPEDKKIYDGLTKFKDNLGHIQYLSGRKGDQYCWDRPCYRGGISKRFHAVEPSLEQINIAVGEQLKKLNSNGAGIAYAAAPVLQQPSPTPAVAPAPHQPASVADQLREARGISENAEKHPPLELARATDGLHLRDMLGDKAGVKAAGHQLTFSR